MIADLNNRKELVLKVEVNFELAEPLSKQGIAV